MTYDDDSGSPGTGRARVATISGNSASFGTAISVTSETYFNYHTYGGIASNNSGKFLVVFQDQGTGPTWETMWGVASVLSVSGTSISIVATVRSAKFALAG